MERQRRSTPQGIVESPGYYRHIAMNTIRNRAKDLFPSVSMTLLSIIQALVLEFLWNQIRDSPYLWTFGWPALLGWLQIVAAVLGILQVWLFNTSVAMRLRWTPYARDLMLPFAIGVLEFIMIDLTGTEHLAWWLVDLAVVYTLAAWIGQDILARARRDPDNHEYFSAFQQARLTDLVTPVVAVAILLASGVAVYFLPSQTLSLAAIGFAVGCVGHRVVEGRRYWNFAMGVD
jgi:hypothetical protein